MDDVGKMTKIVYTREVLKVRGRGLAEICELAHKQADVILTSVKQAEILFSCFKESL